ncbi:hypothetical protein [Arachnia propionica]|uniref:hypothetical protein n=1 Tax=Arachnia propionica TaxID=1750 RepID=UPI00163A67B5|nr:hypothetical protein [Arachnia propionica]
MLTVGLLFLGGVADKPTDPVALTEIPDDASNILQTVNLGVGPDGTIRSITSEAAAESPEKLKSVQVSNQYSPADFAKDLPVRLTTSYQTDTTRGTDLADLAGHTGRVVIELKLQNLTMRPTTVQYDAGGRSLQEQALVGAPMTIFAATTLPGTAPSAVVLEGEEQDASSTNGVLAQLPDGTTSVQWATLLSPPATTDTATLRLVVEAQEMKVPEFDLSVHPGVVSDPRASFLDGAMESETELLERTVALAGDVQLVLDDVGESVAELRKVLSTSTETFGADAVTGLKQSNQQVENSTQALVSQLQGLQNSLDSQLSQSQSAMLSTLQQGVASMEGLLGDPNQFATPTPPASGGDACSGGVVPASSDGSVAGLLAQVSTQLDQYATASEECRGSVRESILASLGPEDPSQEGACPAPPPVGRVEDDQSGAVQGVEPEQRQVPVTCALWEARTTAQENITRQFGQDRDALLMTLEPQSLDATFATHKELGEALTVVNERVKALDEGITQPDVQALREALQDFSKDLSRMESWLERQHDFAESQQQNTNRMTKQNREAAQELCTLLRNSDEPADELARVYGSLTDEPCVLADGSELQIPRDANTQSLQEQLGQQHKAWGTISSEMSPEGDEETSGHALLARLRAAEQKMSEQVTGLEDLGGQNDDAANSARESLKESLTTLETTNTKLGQDLDQLAASQKQLQEDLRKTFDQVIEDVNEDVSEAIDPTIRQIRVDGQRTAEAWDASTRNSAKDLREVSRGLSADSKQTIEDRAQALRDTSDGAAAFISDQLSVGGQALAENLGNSAQDIDGTRAQLVLDLQNALADLGDPTVDGGGLLGTMATSTAAAATTDEQVTLATTATTSFANVRSEDVSSIEKRRAVFLASLDVADELPLFQLESSPGARTATVYTIQIRSEQSR